MPVTIDPTSLAFLLAENRNQPMHVAGLQLFEKPADAGPGFTRELYESALRTQEVAPLFRAWLGFEPLGVARSLPKRLRVV